MLVRFVDSILKPFLCLSIKGIYQCYSKCLFYFSFCRTFVSLQAVERRDRICRQNTEIRFGENSKKRIRENGKIKQQIMI